MITEYRFDEQLAMSQGHSQSRDVRDILLENIPGATAAYMAEQDDDRNGIDWWVEHNGGGRIAVDCKVRKEDWAATHPNEDDLALETWSVVEANKIGWTRDDTKQTDYILWLWTDTGRWCLLPFRMLCGVFQDKWEEWKAQYKTREQHTTDGSGWHSECTFVPRHEVWAEIYRQYSGTLDAP